MMQVRDHLHAMSLAIDVAKQGVRTGHRPFGCVITDEAGFVLATAYGTESRLDPTRHSEMLAIRTACKKLDRLLHGCTIYSTHEPCAMCCGAITHAKLSTVVYGSMRDDLPELFRSRKNSLEELLGDTTTPPSIVEIMNYECVALFDDDLRAHYAAKGSEGRPPGHDHHLHVGLPREPST